MTAGDWAVPSDRAGGRPQSWEWRQLILVGAEGGCIGGSGENSLKAWTSVVERPLTHLVSCGQWAPFLVKTTVT